ncbi:MAG: GNAT family N-acetyltransferase [Chitinophagales bacterium]
MVIFDCTKQLILEDKRVRLTPLVSEDADSLLPIVLHKPKLHQYSPSEAHTPELLATYIAGALLLKTQGIRYPFLIFDKKAKKYAGSTSFGNISNKNSRVEIGWTWIGYDFQGTGLNTHMKFLMLQYAFETLGFERVELKADGRNTQSRRAMEKIGATFEGTLRSHTVMSDGYRRNTVYYSILQSEWQGVKAGLIRRMA